MYNGHLFLANYLTMFIPASSYHTTELDPSVYAATEAYITTDVPLPDAYGTQDIFYAEMMADDIVNIMLNGDRPLHMNRRRMGFKTADYVFTGETFVSWLVTEFIDIPDRQTAITSGNTLVLNDVITPFGGPKRLLDNYTFYQLAERYQPKSGKTIRQQTGNSAFMTGSLALTRAPASSLAITAPPAATASTSDPSEGVQVDSEGRTVIPMSHSIIINVDPQTKSDRNETAFLHFDIAHNPSNGFHFQLDWLCTSRLVDDILALWQRGIDKYGLKLVEENIRQIKDIGLDNPFEMAEHIPLVVAPPIVNNIEDVRLFGFKYSLLAI